jgi:prephenate dehydratase
MTLLALGPEGTFSHELAKRIAGDDIRLRPTIHAIFTEVVKGRADGIVPIENSEAGGVGPTLDGLRSFSVFITGECTMPVALHLAAFVPLDKITVIYAHPQSHEQCSELLDSLSVPVIHTSSNAASAVAILKEKTQGAIVSRMTADLYNIPIIRSHVENSPDNTTRFIRISARRRTDREAGKCSLIIDPAIDRPGLLHDILGVFAIRGINLSRIESRPSKRGMGNYIFFIDVALTERLPDALTSLRTLTDFKELGCYGTIEVGSWD